LPCAITSISWIAESPPCRTRPRHLGDQLESANGPRERLAEMELLRIGEPATTWPNCIWRVDLAKLSHTLFLPYLSGYFQVERENLNERVPDGARDRYYEEQGHVLQQQQVGPHNLLQHIFSAARRRAGRRPGSASAGLSVANIVAEVSQSCSRCRHLSQSLRVLQRAKELADIFFRYIYDEHVQERRRAISCGLEAQIQQGLERTLAAIVGHVRHLLNSEQKAADFRPPIGGSDAAPASAVALRTPAPRCLVEHLHKFKYSLSGGLQALCDLTEYMACLKPVRHSGFLVDGHDLYDVLCKLLNLLVIQPANLHDICEEESLRSLSREVKQSFIMLRTDSGSAEVKAALEKI
uniref:Exocyst complex component 5 n=1 Tax=Macrostomum lignano TaxID=282301 RepID=A0A1I8FUA9_9PLAT